MQGGRWPWWLWALGGGLIALAVILAIWKLPSLLYGDVSEASPDARLQAASGFRTAFVAGLAGIAALLSLAMAYRTYRLTQQGQITERYTKAIEQLGSDKLDVRLGGIYALERIAKDSKQDHPTVVEVLVTFARLESQTIGLRVSAQAEQQAKAGKPWRGGRYLPYGYGADRVTVEPAEAAVVNEIADRLLAGHSEGAVVQWLSEAGIPAPESGRWNRAKLRSLMTNPRLAGLRAYRGEVVAEAVWPAIIDRSRFERLVRLFGQRARPGRPATRWLVSGIVRCGLCDAPLELRGHAAGTRYVCDRQVQRAGREKPGCGKVTIVAEPVDLLVAKRVLDRLAGPRLARARRHLDSAKLRAIFKQREEDRQALVEAASERFVARTLDPAAYLEVKGELERRIADADRRLDQDGSTTVLAALPRVRAELDSAWQAADIEQQREIVRAVVRYLVIRPASRRGAGLDPERVVIPPEAWRV